MKVALVARLDAPANEVMMDDHELFQDFTVSSASTSYICGLICVDKGIDAEVTIENTLSQSRTLESWLESMRNQVQFTLMRNIPTTVAADTVFDLALGLWTTLCWYLGNTNHQPKTPEGFSAKDVHVLGLCSQVASFSA